MVSRLSTLAKNENIFLNSAMMRVQKQGSHFIPDDHPAGNNQILSSAEQQAYSRILEHPYSPKVQFAGHVRVRWIPSRHDYSPATKSALWATQQEILENATRNTIEYASEGWEIAKVLEDESMVNYFGRKIHPVHFCEDSTRKDFLCNIMEKRRKSRAKRIMFPV